MTSDTDYFELLKRRRDDLLRRREGVLRQLEDLNREQERLEQEAKEVEITQKVLESLSPEARELRNRPYLPPATKKGRKPDGTPTIAEMISDALCQAEMSGYGGLESQPIIEHIRAKWWPDAQSNDIAPLLWRLAKNKKLDKRGSSYFRVVEPLAKEAGKSHGATANHFGFENLDPEK